SATAAVASPDNKEWTGKVKLPNDKGVHKWTITAKDNLGTVTTGDFTADFSNCPGGPTACPAKAIEKQVSLNDPVMICAFENDPTLAQQNAGKAVAWSQTGAAKGISFSALTLQGQCLVAPHMPGSFDQDQEIDLQYSVLPDGPNNCPAKIINPKLFLQGSGQGRFGCSLNGDLPATHGIWAMLAGLSLLAVAGWWTLRRAALK